MTLTELVREIAQAEGKTKRTSAQVREVLNILSRMLVMNEEVEKCLIKNGQRTINKEIMKRGIAMNKAGQG